MANHARTTSFDRAAIMRSAHQYARAYADRDWSYAKLLSWGLKAGWESAKSNQTETERRAASIRAEIDALSYKSFQINTTPIRQKLESELSALAA